MFVRRKWVVVAAVGILAACADEQSPAPVTVVAPLPPVENPPASAPASTEILLYADGPQDVMGTPGETLDDFPRLRVIRNGMRVPGVTVTFHRPSTGDSTVAVTDSTGVAHFGRFTFGAKPGTEQVFAVAGDRFRVEFTGTIKAALVDRFDLVDVGGLPLPLSYSAGDRSWQVTGGHYLLRSDGTYDFYYDGGISGGGMRPRPTGRYERSGTTIDFYLYPPYGSFYHDRNGHFSRGTLAGRVMTVTYEDPINFEIERYVRVTP